MFWQKDRREFLVIIVHKDQPLWEYDLSKEKFLSLRWVYGFVKDNSRIPNSDPDKFHKQNI